MTLWQRGRSRARLSSVAISYKPSISCYHTVSISPPSILTTLTQRTRASTLVLARVFCVPIFPSSTPRRCPGHERAYWCSLVLWASFSLPLQRPADSQGTSEHTGARPCPVCPLFYVPSTPHGRAGHERARRCLPVSCTSFVPCPFDIPWTRRTRASTPVLARVLYVLFSMSLPHPVDAQDTSEHAGARPCPDCHFFMSLRHLVDAQDTSEHTSACSCPYLSLRHPVDA